MIVSSFLIVLVIILVVMFAFAMYHGTSDQCIALGVMVIFFSLLTVYNASKYDDQLSKCTELQSSDMNEEPKETK